MLETDKLTDQTIETMEEILTLDFYDMFGLWVCMAEAMAEQWPRLFAAQLIKWAYQSLDASEDNRWDNLRWSTAFAVKAMPIELRTHFLDIKAPPET